MINYTNINIKDIDSTYKYILEYEPSYSIVKTEKIRWNYSDTSQSVEIYDEYINAIRHENIWKNINYNDNLGSYKYFPTDDDGNILYKTSKIKLYFPKFSVDTYEDGVRYALSIHTWIHGRKVSLGCYIVNRLDALACAPKRFIDDNYHEYIEFIIIDPWELTYSDDWADFRQSVCSEPENLNATGSILYFSLYPVQFVGDRYIMIDKYQGGQNSINISLNESDYLNLHIRHNINEINVDPKIICELRFNNIYGNNIYDYLAETYNIDIESVDLSYDLIVKDDNDCYKYYKSNSELLAEQDDLTKYEFNVDFDNWEGYKEGLVIIGSLSFIDKNGNTIMYLKSNEIPLDQKLFSYLVGNKNRDINYVNLDEVDMYLYNMNVVNKTVNEITQIDRPDDSKSNIIQPVFFKARDVANIIVHPAVTEYISINLDAFKSKVDTFMIQIEGCTFLESGRTSSGVIFKVVGSKLPNSVKEGLYYVLNQDAELVTNGKYKYDE